MNKNKKKKKKIIASIVFVIIIIVIIVYHYNFKSSTVSSSAIVEGYVKKVYPEEGKILICYEIRDILNEEYMGDCYIPIEKDTVISDGRTLDSIVQGEHIIAIYTGTLAEVHPAEIDGTVLVKLVK